MHISADIASTQLSNEWAILFCLHYMFSFCSEPFYNNYGFGLKREWVAHFYQHCYSDISDWGLIFSKTTTEIILVDVDQYAALSLNKHTQSQMC